jgi:hypothetical protein
MLQLGVRNSQRMLQWRGAPAVTKRTVLCTRQFCYDAHTPATVGLVKLVQFSLPWYIPTCNASYTLSIAAVLHCCNSNCGGLHC